MEKIFITKTFIEELGTSAEYFLIKDNDTYGIEIKEKGGPCKTRKDIPDSEENVIKFIEQLADNAVTPEQLDCVANDYVTGLELAIQ